MRLGKCGKSQSNGIVFEKVNRFKYPGAADTENNGRSVEIKQSRSGNGLLRVVEIFSLGIIPKEKKTATKHRGHANTVFRRRNVEKNLWGDACDDESD